MRRKCINCKWEGEEVQVIGPLKHCPNCGDNTKELVIEEKKVEKVEKPKRKKFDFDLNKDGKVDKKDRSIAARLLGSEKGKRKK